MNRDLFFSCNFLEVKEYLALLTNVAHRKVPLDTCPVGEKPSVTIVFYTFSLISCFIKKKSISELLCYVMKSLYLNKELT
jgi:hypothetical protein